MTATPSQSSTGTHATPGTRPVAAKTPAAIVTVPGVLANQETGAIVPLTLDPPNHTLYALTRTTDRS